MKCRHCRQCENERIKPIGTFVRQKAVHKNTRKRRRDNTYQRRNEGRKHDKSNGNLSSVQPFYGKREDAFPLSGGNKVFVRFKHQADACKRLVEGLHRHRIIALGRIVDDSLFSLESVKHDKVIEIPMNDTGEFPVLFQIIRLISVSLGNKSIASGGNKKIFCIRTIARHAAIDADLFKRYPFVVICAHHGKRRRTALKCFHLHDDGDFGDAFRERTFDFNLFIIFHTSPQLNTKYNGDTLSTTTCARYTPSGIFPSICTMYTHSPILSSPVCLAYSLISSVTDTGCELTDVTL